MKCSNCGFEREEAFKFCPNCGYEAVQPTAPAPDPADVTAQPEQTASVVLQEQPLCEVPQNRLLSALKDKLYLVICILISVTCGLSLLNGGIPVIEVLLTIFSWLTFAQSRKNIISSNHLRCISGTVFADYILNYVLCGLLAVLGLLLAIIFSMALSFPSLLDDLLSELGDYSYVFDSLPAMGISIIGWVIFFVLLIVAAGVFALNFFGMRKIHAFAKSIYQGAESGVLNFEHANTVKNWLLVLGILAAVGAFGSTDTESSIATIGFITSASNGATMIIASILIKKHFLTP